MVSTPAALDDADTSSATGRGRGKWKNLQSTPPAADEILRLGAVRTDSADGGDFKCAGEERSGCSDAKKLRSANDRYDDASGTRKDSESSFDSKRSFDAIGHYSELGGLMKRSQLSDVVDSRKAFDAGKLGRPTKEKRVNLEDVDSKREFDATGHYSEFGGLMKRYSGTTDEDVKEAFDAIGELMKYSSDSTSVDLKRAFDSIGHYSEFGGLMKKSDSKAIVDSKKAFDTIGHYSELGGLMKRHDDSENVDPKREFDAIGHYSDFGGLMKRPQRATGIAEDSKREFDAIGHYSDFGGLMKRQQSPTGTVEDSKREFDAIGHYSDFGGLMKRPRGSTGVVEDSKREFDAIGHYSDFGGLMKRRRGSTDVVEDSEREFDSIGHFSELGGLMKRGATPADADIKRAFDAVGKLMNRPGGPESADLKQAFDSISHYNEFGRLMKKPTSDRDGQSPYDIVRERTRRHRASESYRPHDRSVKMATRNADQEVKTRVRKGEVARRIIRRSVKNGGRTGREAVSVKLAIQKKPYFKKESAFPFGFTTTFCGNQSQAGLADWRGHVSG